MNTQEKIALYNKFQEMFPIESLATMSLEKYTNLNKDSFSYWIEFGTRNLGSIKGGTSEKFGVYKYTKKPISKRVQFDDTHAWYKKYNVSTAQEAYDIVRKSIVKIANAAQKYDLDTIELDETLGEAIKWKIAFMYSNLQIVPWYNRTYLENIAKHFSMPQPETKTIAAIQRFLRNQKGEQNTFEFSDGLALVADYDKHSKQVSTDIQYWVCAPGEQARKWEECQQLNIISLGWDEIGDAHQYESREQLASAMKELYNKPDRPFSNDSLAIWEFTHKMKEGDIIYAKSGRKEIIGRGVIESDYIYDDVKAEYKHIRKVNWTHIGNWKLSSLLAMKTLTNITRVSNLVTDLETMIVGNQKTLPIQPTQIVEANNYWWLVANPKIWSMQSQPQGEIINYSLFNDNRKKRRIFQNFIDAQEGDIVIGYESTPVLQIVALYEVASASDGKELTFRKIESLASPIPLKTIKEVTELNEMQFLTNPQGSFFALTEEEYDMIMDIIREENPLQQTKQNIDKYTSVDFLREVFIEEKDYNHLAELLLTKQNIILQGAPGVGKTFSAKRIAYSLLGEKDDSKIELVQFHQSYSYEDFIMGYKPTENGGFELKQGVFYRFCKRAASDPENKYFFIIDEINRGNLSKILGELMMLIEKGYRGENYKIKLAYSDEPFFVPTNVYLIGMMNTADRSLAMIDYALRRRFSFFEMRPGFKSPGFIQYQSQVQHNKFNQLIDAVIRLNETICQDDSLGLGFCIGHSYFCNQETITDSWLYNVVEYDIVPMLNEYWFDDKAKATTEAEALRNIL